MKIRYTTTLLISLMCASVAWSQTRPATGSQPLPTKVGVVNIQVAIANTAEGKQASAELQAEFAPRQAEIQNLSKQIDDLRNRLQTGATTLSDEEKARLAREGDQLTRSFQRKQQDLQDDSTEAQRAVVDRIGNKMLKVLDQYGREHGYALIVDSSGQNLVLYAANQTDLTQETIKLYDETYPVKTSPSPRPSGAKPKP